MTFEECQDLPPGTVVAIHHDARSGAGGADEGVRKHIIVLSCGVYLTPYGIKNMNGCLMYLLERGFATIV